MTSASHDRASGPGDPTDLGAFRVPYEAGGLAESDLAPAMAEYQRTVPLPPT